MKKFFVLSLMALVLAGCGFGKTKLTDENVTQWIAATRTMHAMGAQGQEPDDTQIEQAAKDAGFSSLFEYMQVTASISVAWSQLQSGSYQDNMEEMFDESYYQDIFNNPDIPEENKEEARQQLEIAREEWERNQEMAQPVLDFAGNFTDEESIEILQAHEQELMELMVGQYSPEAMEYMGY